MVSRYHFYTFQKCYQQSIEPLTFLQIHQDKKEEILTKFDDRFKDLPDFLKKPARESLVRKIKKKKSRYEENNSLNLVWISWSFCIGCLVSMACLCYVKILIMTRTRIYWILTNQHDHWNFKYYVSKCLNLFNRLKNASLIRSAFLFNTVEWLYNLFTWVDCTHRIKRVWFKFKKHSNHTSLLNLHL